MTDILDEALGISSRPSMKDLQDGEEEIPILDNPMVALEPNTPPVEAKQPETDDVLKDYEHSRDVALTNLKQAQIALEAATDFVNSSPSARSFEVLGGLVKTVNECNDRLLEVHKKMKDLAAKGSGGKDNSEGGGDTFIFYGDPHEAIKHIRDNDGVIDGHQSN